MNIARIVNGEIRYPYHLFHLRADFPNTSWPEDWACIDLASVDCVEVSSVAPPTAGQSQQVVEGSPALVDGVWSQTWRVLDVPVEVPNQVPAHHLRRALRAAGMLSAVQAYIDALPNDNGMKDDWEYAPYFRRDAVGIVEAAAGLGLTSAQVDGLFIAAGSVVT